MSQKFWCLSEPDSTVGLAERDRQRIEELEKLRGPVGLQAAERTDIALPVLVTSRKLKDFVWTWNFNCLVQDRVLDLFRSLGFTGFEVLPIEARAKRRKPGADWDENVRAFMEEQAASIEIPRLWEIMVTGWGGIAPPESGIKFLGYKECCIKGVTGPSYSKLTNAHYLIDEKQWDGSDFFIVWPIAKYIFVSDRVAKIIKNNKLRGCKLEPSEALVDPFAGYTYNPCGLRYYLPEKRAREIGEPLGIY